MYRSLCYIFVASLCSCCLAKDHNVVRAFVDSNCLDCHTGDDAEGSLDLQNLSTELNHDNFESWVRIFDRVESGEMPPKDAQQPESRERKKFVDASSEWLKTHQQEDYQRRGRVQGRRLTSRQLERTLHDLLGIDIPLASMMPDEPRTNGFTTVAAGQSFSHFQMQTHLKVVDAALDEAVRRGLSEPDEWSRTLSPEKIARANPRRRCREPEMLDGKAVVWSGNTTFYGRLPVTTAKHDGWYRIHVKASGLNVPKDHGVWCTVRTGMCVSSSPMLAWVGAFAAQEEPGDWTFETWLKKGDMFEIRPGDGMDRKAKFAGGQIGAGEGTPQNVPGVAHHEIILERFHRGPGNNAIRKSLFGSMEVKPATNRQSGAVIADKPWKDASNLIRQFATRAFRRPVDAKDVQPYVAIVHRNLKDGEPFLQALRAGYRAILCSARFMYLEESPGQLDDFALASRLSYLLWSSMPDDELMALAANGQLRQSSVLKQQTSRMLKDRRGQSFVKDFAHEWLDLSEIDFTEPDRRQHRDFDVIVQGAMLDETHAFLQELLDHNLPVGNLIHADFTFLNNRLARHYDIPNVEGDELRKVALTPDDRRGGVLTQGAVLKVTANGSTTSPVLRGVWVAERLLGYEIPPPPASVSAIEPDIRGARSIREMLEKHKADTSCASCHVKIDPPGFALENFDPAGRWRDRYRTVTNRKPTSGGLKIDPSYELPNGEKFNGLREFQALILDDESAIAANFARQLLTYGTGAACGFADRSEIDDVVTDAGNSGYGIRSILDAVIGSQVFQTK